MIKKDADISVSETLGDESSESRIYELGFHVDPELPVEEVKKVYQEVRRFIEKHGSIVAEGEPEKIQLAYTISKQETKNRRDFDSAYFCWIAYESLVGNHSEIIGEASVNKHIIRFIDLITTKDAARHSVEMHELSMKTQERSRDEEETTKDVELDAAIENVTV